MSRFDLSQSDLAALLADLPAYRIRQLWAGLYERLADPDQLSELPVSLRRRLAGLAELSLALEVGATSEADRGATCKWLLRLGDGAAIETVLMHHLRHSTVCVSSQAGCAMACTFCATGDAGFTRQLSTGEILEQVVLAARASRAQGRRLDHVVFMGMGEPLANLAAVWPAVERIVNDLGLAARHVTISTVGIVPGIRRLAGESLQVNLAVSLHAANDRLRDQLVPINRRYRIATLVEACQDYVARTHRRISLEWALMDAVNDTATDARELADLARRLRAHVNLIPLNPTRGGLSRGLRGSPAARVRTFRDELAAQGVNVTVRRTHGRAIDGACGQLAGSNTALEDAAARPLAGPRPTAAAAPTTAT